MGDGRAVNSALTPEVQVGIARLRDELAALHAELVRRGAFPETGAVLSARVPDAELQLVSTPAFPDVLRPESLLLCDLDGVPVADTPGSDHDVPADARLHGRLYARDPELHGIARLRAAHISAWAARVERLPCVLDAVAEAFGGDLPVGPETLDDLDAYADSLLAARAEGGSRALLLPRDGVLVLAADPRTAARLAVLAEDAAQTTALAGPRLPPEAGP